MPVDVQRLRDRDGALRAVADHTTACLSSALKAKEKATLALSGGQTIKLLLPLVSVADLAWSKITLTLVDERWVGIYHPDSNQGMVERYLRSGTCMAIRVIGLKTSHSSPEEAVAEVERRLNKLSWPLDAVVLGMGEDGHVASLFPGSVALSKERGHCIPIGAGDGRQPRMSLSPSMLLNSKVIFLVVLGREKRKTFELASRSGSPLEYPVRLLLQQDRTPVTVFLAD